MIKMLESVSTEFLWSAIIIIGCLIVVAIAYMMRRPTVVRTRPRPQQASYYSVANNSPTTANSPVITSKETRKCRQQQ